LDFICWRRPVFGRRGKPFFTPRVAALLIGGSLAVGTHCDQFLVSWFSISPVQFGGLARLSQAQPDLSRVIFPPLEPPTAGS